MITRNTSTDVSPIETPAGNKTISNISGSGTNRRSPSKENRRTSSKENKANKAKQNLQSEKDSDYGLGSARDDDKDGSGTNMNLSMKEDDS